MADSTVISGVSDLPRFYFAQGAKMRLTLNVGAEFPLAGKFAEFGIRARSGKVRRIFRTDSDESNLSITSQVVSVDIDPADETVPAFSGGWTLADVQALAETEYWVDFSDTEGGPVLLRLQGQANWVSAGDDIEESAAVVAAPEIDVAISSGAVTVTVAVTGGEVGIPVGGTTGQVLSKASGSDYDTEWITASGLGTVTSVAVSGSDGIQVDSGSPITSSGTIALGVDAAALRSHINVEDGADVTDATNVTAAGAVMDSEVSSLSGIKTLTVPDNTTISAFGASLVDDADAATARATLGVDAAGTDNSTDVTLAGTPDYITISGQVITRNAVDLAADITGTLPVGNGGTGVTSLGSLDAADLGSGASTDGYVLTSDGLGGSAWEASTGGGGTVSSVAVSGTDGIEVDSGSPITSSGTITLGVNAATLSSHLGLGTAATSNTGDFEAAGAVSTHAAVTSGVHGISAFGATLIDDADAATARTTLGVDAAGTDNSTDVTLAGTPDYITISGQVITRNAVDLAADITGTLPVANGGTGVTALSSIDAADLGSGAGTDGYVLTADGAGGAAWEAASGGGGGGGASNIWIPASSLIPKTTSGCGVNSSETTTNDQNYDSADFDAGADEFADFMLILPNNWDYGTIIFRPYWTADSGSGTVCWALKGVAYADDDSLDTAGGTAQTSTDTLLAAGDMHVGPASSAITIGGTAAANKPVQFTVYRDVSEDTLAVDARLLGIEILYTLAT